MDGLDDWQQGRGLFLLEAVLSAKKHSLHIQFQQNSSFWFTKVDTKHAAQNTVTEEERCVRHMKSVLSVWVVWNVWSYTGAETSPDQE